MIRLLCTFLILCVTTAHADTPKRIVSVGGALTETVYALGAGEYLVGSDTTSYYPAAAAASPKVGYQRTLSAEGILSLNPDLVILSGESGPPAVLAQLKSAGVNMLTLGAGRSVEDVKRNIETLSEALDKEQQGNKLIAELTAASSKLEQALSQQNSPKRIMFILQHSGGAPLVAGMGTAASSIIELSGSKNAVTEYEGYKPLSPESATAMAPDIILVTTQGLEQSGGEASLLKIPGVSLTPAAKQGNVIAMDALFLLGFGPRVTEAALELNRRAKEL